MSQEQPEGEDDDIRYFVRIGQTDLDGTKSVERSLSEMNGIGRRTARIICEKADVDRKATFGRLEDEPLPDLSVFPEAIMEFESPPGTYYDAFPLMVMTEQALSAMSSAIPDSVVDVRRFRPSFVIDAGDASATTPGHPEFDWVGRSARIGSAVVEFNAACPRCVMITREVDDSIPQDRGVLRHVVRELDQNVGVYGKITTPGTIAQGDTVEFV